MKRMRCLFFLLGVLILCMPGCGRGITEENGGEETRQEETCDWQNVGFAAEEEVGEGLFLTDYTSVEYEAEKSLYGNSCYIRAYGEYFFVTDIFYGEEKTTYRFLKYGLNGEILFQTDIDTGAWGIEKGSIVQMDVVDSKQLVFWVGSEYGKNERKQWKPKHFYAVYTDGQCGFLKSVDLMETIQANQIWDSQDTFGSDLDCDNEGNLYFRDQQTHTIFVLSPEAKLLGRHSYQAGERQEIQSLRMNGKQVAFCCEVTEGNYQYIWLNPENAALKQLGTTEGESITECYGLWGNTLYYETGNSIISRDISTGEKGECINLKEYELGGLVKKGLLTTEEELRLFAVEENERYIMEFSAKKPQTNELLTFMNTSSRDSALNSVLKGRVFAFSRENPLLPVEYKEAFGEEDTERVWIEMINGKGPDVLYIDASDMQKLAEKEALGDLSGLLDEETKAAILPGAIELGTREGKLAGIPLVVRIDTIITNRQYWQEDSWSITDILQIMKKQQELKGLFVDYLSLGDNYGYNMYFLLAKSIEDTSYVKDGKSCFDCREFRELLELVKAKSNDVMAGQPGGFVTENAGMIVNGGQYLGIQTPVSSMNSFGNYLKIIGENGNMVGHPSDSGNGNYLDANSVLVVNQNAVEKPGVRELIQYLLSLESQQRMNVQNISVRWDVPESQFGCFETENQKRYVLQLPNREMLILPATPDNEPYLEEYVEFIKSAVPGKANDEVFNIVMEEAEKYFHSDMDVETVVEIIQNRVQLYLDENL